MKITWHNFEIESEYVGTKNASWDNDSADRHHVITITNTDYNTSVKFNFWTSKVKPRITEEYQLFEAVDAFLSDAELGDGRDFYEFCDEMGYDVPRGTYESWKACRVAKMKAVKVFGTHWCELANEVRRDGGVWD